MRGILVAAAMGLSHNPMVIATPLLESGTLRFGRTWFRSVSLSPLHSSWQALMVWFVRYLTERTTGSV